MTSENQHTKTLKFGVRLATENKKKADAVVEQAILDNSHPAEGLARQASHLMQNAIDGFEKALIVSPNEPCDDYHDAVGSIFKGDEKLCYAQDALALVRKEPE